MNRINPLYLLLLCFTITFISFITLSSIKADLAENSKKFELFKQKAISFTDLKKSVGSKKESLSQINLIMKSFKEQNISSDIIKSKAIIKLQTTQKKLVQNFLNKFLNKKLKITAMEITKSYVVIEVAL